MKLSHDRVLIKFKGLNQYFNFRYWRYIQEMPSRLLLSLTSFIRVSPLNLIFIFTSGSNPSPIWTVYSGSLRNSFALFITLVPLYDVTIEK